MKKLFSTLLIISIMVMLFVYSNAGNQKSDPFNVLKQWEDAINKKDVNRYLEVFDEEMATGIKTAIENRKDKKNIQFYSLDSVKLINVIEISEEIAKNVYPIYVNSGMAQKYLYLYYEGKTHENSKYTKDGENFIICVMSKNKENKWVISQFSCAPVQALINNGITLGSHTEKEIKNNNVGIRTVYEVPEYIDVYLMSTLKYDGETNYQYWGVPKYTVQQIPLYTYIKDVLPNEWDCDIVVPDKYDESTKLYNALEAGAIMVKTFACYHVLYPWNPNIGADVNDQNSQVYLHGTVNKLASDGTHGSSDKFEWGAMCEDAIDDEGHHIIMNIQSYKPIFAHYNQDAQNETYRLDRDLHKNEEEIAKSIYVDYFREYPSYYILIL
jgi:hypothetical protein